MQNPAGTYSQVSTGTMNVSIGGTVSGTQYSQLKVSGVATLAGTLTAALVNNFTPTVGQTFTILTGSSVTGSFTNTTIAINSSEHFSISYTATSVVLTVVSGPVGAAPAPVTASNAHDASATKHMAATAARYVVGGAVRATRPIYVAGLNHVEGRSNLIPADVLRTRHIEPVTPVRNWLAERPAPVAGTAIESVVRESLPPANPWAGRIARGTAMPGLIGTTRREQLPVRVMPGHRPMAGVR